MKTVKNPLTETWVMAESDLTHPPEQRPGLTPCHPNRVLIADDEINIRDVFQRVLEAELPSDCVLDMAADGAAAVDMFLEGHHKTILMDLAMPTMDGLQTFERIQEICAEKSWQPPKVVFCTGFDPPLGVRNIVAADPSHCLLCKPVSNRTLLLAVKKRLAVP